MDTYYDEYSAPLAYHKFLKYFGLPLNILLTFGGFLNVINYIPESGVYALIDLVYVVTELVLLGMALYGFYTWKSCGFYCMLSHLILSAAYSLFMVFLYAGLAPEQVGTQIGSFIGTLIAGVPIGIYYLKRRPLFLENVRSAYIYERMQQSRPANYTPVVHLDDCSHGDPTVCRVCGEKLNPGRAACMKCGTAVPATSAVTQTEAVRPCYCHKCGNKLIENSRFCSRCGTQIQ